MIDLGADLLESLEQGPDGTRQLRTSAAQLPALEQGGVHRGAQPGGSLDPSRDGGGGRWVGSRHGVLGSVADQGGGAGLQQSSAKLRIGPD